MELVNKNQPMREAEIESVDFINNKLTDLVMEMAIPDDNSIGIEKLDRSVKKIQTLIEAQDITFTVENSDDQLLLSRVTLQNNREAVPDTDWKYAFNGAFASLKAEYTDQLAKKPVFVTTSVESVTRRSVTIAVILFIMLPQTAGTVFNATLSTVWNCWEDSPM